MSNETIPTPDPAHANAPEIPPNPRRPRVDEPLYQTLMMPLGILLCYGALVMWLLFPGDPLMRVACLGMGIMFMTVSVFLRPSGVAGVAELVFHWSKGYQALNVLLVVIMLGLLVLGNYMVYRRSTKIDFTMQQLYSLSDQTKQTLSGLKDEVTAVAFYPDLHGYSQESQLFASYRRKVKETLDDYVRYSNGKFKYDLIDPLKDPATTKRYQLGEGEWGTVFVEQKNGRKVKVAREKIFSRSNPYGGGSQYKGEEALTGALLEMQSGQKLTVYFLEGHGERQLDSDQPTGYASLKTFLERERYDIKQLKLFQTEKVPDDCSCLVVAGPQKPFSPKEIERLRAFINTPGKGVMFLVDTTPLSGLKELLAELGIEWSANIVIEPDPQLSLEGNPVTFVAAPKEHAITHELVKNKMGLALHEATYLNKLARPADKYEMTPLLETLSNSSWAEFDMTSIQTGRVKLDPGVDKVGPLTLGWAIEIKHGPAKADGKLPEDPFHKPEEKKDDGPRSRVVVIGDSDFPSDLIRMAFPIGGNTDLFMNSVAWCAFSSDKSATIRPKDEPTASVTLTGDKQARVGRFTLIVYPMTVLVIGVLVWYRRSNL